MQKIIVFILMFLPLGLFAQNEAFTIKGKFGNYDAPVSISISYTDLDTGKTFNDSCILKNGVFTLKGSVKNPVIGHLSFLHNTSFIWLEEGLIEINSPDLLNNMTISGSKLNDDQKRFDEAIKGFFDKWDQLMKEQNSLLSPEIKNSAEYKAKISRKFSEKRKKEVLPICLQFIKANPSSLISLLVLKNYYDPIKFDGNAPVVADVKPLFESLSENVRTSPLGKQFQSDMGKWEKVEIGSIAPDFSQNDPEGNPVKLSDYKGKYVLIDFWASWCHPCRAENPNLTKQYNLYKNKNFTILSISLDTDKSQWLKAIKEDQLSWKQVSDLKRQNEVREKYGVQSIPDNFLINPEGKVIAKSLRGETLRNKLKETFDK